MRRVVFALAVLVVLAGVRHAHAVPTTYFGENTSPGGTVSGAPLTARNSFLAALAGGVGTEDFESFPDGTGTPLALTFPGSTGSITATLNGSGAINQFSKCCGRFATSGTQIWETDQAFSIDFSSPVAAFGFYATDIGDFDGTMSLTLTGGGTTGLTIPHTVNGPNGSLLFFGFTDTSQTYTSVAFGNTSGGSDVFGFDDMTIGDLQQVQALVPEPSTLALAGLGLLGLCCVRRRRKR